jgi:hypothetical protein
MHSINLSDVTIEYFAAIPETKQSPEFYAVGGSCDYAIVTRGDREARVAINGEMHLTIPNIVNGELDDTNAQVIRYGDEFSDLFKDDIHFWQFVKTISLSGFEIYRMNPWWEVYDKFDPEGGVYDTFYEAIEGAIATVLDDEYWSQP